MHNGEGNGTPLQYSCLENPMDGGAWYAAVHGVAKSRTRLSDFTFTFSRSCIGEGNGNPLQCSCLENPRDGGAWSMGLHRVGHDWSDLAAAAALIGLEKAMATHSRTLAWKISWTEELSRLQSMGSLRVEHDWATSVALFIFMNWRRKWQTTPVFLPGESQGQWSLVGCRLWGHIESNRTEVT